MEKNKAHILDTARSKGLATPSAGLDVPDGYFEDFARHIMATLPDRPELEHPDDVEARTTRTLWQRVRPYVYMAAMFAGIWLMLQMFGMLTGAGRLQPMDTNPVLAEALSNDAFVDMYVYDDYSSWDAIDDFAGDPDVEYVFDIDDSVKQDPNIVLP